MFSEDFFNDGHFLIAAGLFQAQEQDTSVRLSRTINQFPKILIHGYDQSLLPHGQGEDVKVWHSRIKVSYSEHIVALGLEPLFDSLTDSHID